MISVIFHLDHEGCVNARVKEQEKRCAILFTFVFTNNIKLGYMYIVLDYEEQICYTYRIYSIKHSSIYSRGAFIMKSLFLNH